MATSADRQQDASPGSTVTSARADTAQGAEAVEAVESVDANDAIEAIEAAETAGDTDEAPWTSEATGPAETPAPRTARASAAPAERFGAGPRRLFFQIAAGLSALAALIALSMPGPTAFDAHWLGATFVVLGGAAIGGLWLSPQRQPTAMMAFIGACSVGLAAMALAFRSGLGDAALGLYGVLVCVSCAGSGRRGGWLVAALQLALLAALLSAAWPQAEQEVGATLLRFALHAVNVATGLAAGHLVVQSLGRHMRAAAERERRFRRLLSLAADAYWETDRGHRLVTVAEPDAEGGALQPQALGLEPWNLPGFGCDPEVLDRLRADLDAREPVRDVPVRWTDGGADDGTAGSRTRHLLVSGAPHADDAGRFIGYWGVVRDVTAAQAARSALQATEHRYRDLFTLSPAPLVLHREGRVLDANPAALALFGHETLQEMLGTHLSDSFEEGDSRERALQRLAQLHGQAVGTSLPVADYRLLVQGRHLSVRGTAVCMEVDGGCAVLSIFADDTERLAADQSVRRSQTLLSHLVATTPDIVTVSDLASGRYTMVNPAFEREFGWSADEAVGRTGIELGIWPAESDREDFVQLLRTQGLVHNEQRRFLRRNAEPILLAVSAARFALDRGDYLVMSGRDVTAAERLRLEREAILTNASVGIAVTRARRIVLANRHFEAMLGWEPGELIGQASRAAWGSDEDYERAIGEFGSVLQRGERVDFECRLARKDGRGFLAHMRAHAVDPARPQDGTVWIVEDITARRESERALEQARSAAEAANRAKSTFLANTSHELRTPLNGIVGLAALASDPALDAALRQRYLEQIVDSARALTAIISDILDLSKIEAGRLELETTAFDLGELLQTMRLTYAPQAAARGLALRLDIGARVSSGVRGDPLRLRQVIGNFLANALKFTSEGEIVLHALRDGEQVRIEVQDTGPGITAQARARLFQPFSQADESTTRRFGGTGLGLSICRELAALMGGEVGVVSEPGHGSRFWLVLPLPEADLPEPAPPPAASSLQGMRVLMVEDNPVNMLIATAMLEGWGVQVGQATDGAQAVQALQEALAAGQLPDAVLMDVQMPVMSGYEATRTLRAMPGFARLPIVALTAAAMVHERDEARAAGMDDFLGKPIDTERLRAALARWRQAGPGQTVARGSA